MAEFADCSILWQIVENHHVVQSGFFFSLKYDGNFFFH